MGSTKGLLQHCEGSASKAASEATAASIVDSTDTGCKQVHRAGHCGTALVAAGLLADCPC